MKLATSLLNWLATFFVACVSQEHASRTKRHGLFRVLTRVSASRDINQIGRVFHRLFNRVDLASAYQPWRRRYSSQLIQVLWTGTITLGYFCSLLGNVVLTSCFLL